VQKDNSPYLYVSPYLQDSNISFMISFSDNFSSLDFSSRCHVDQCKASCVCFLSRLPMLFIVHWCFLL
jgi:hypothetical protein